MATSLHSRSNNSPQLWMTISIPPTTFLIEGEIETDKRYGEEDFNRVIEIREREEYRVKLFMNLINQKEKTLVFCATQEHALAVRDLINQCKSGTDPNYCVG